MILNDLEPSKAGF